MIENSLFSIKKGKNKSMNKIYKIIQNLILSRN